MGEIAKVHVATDNFTGYKLTITGSDDNGYLLGTKNNNKLISITSSISEDVFRNVANTQYNGMWGFKPDKLDSEENSNYLPAPKQSEATIIDTTTTANAEPTTYALSIGARASVDTPIDTYITLAATVNAANYNISYVDLSHNIPEPTYGSTTDEWIRLTYEEPVREGYEFKGWCTKPTTTDQCSGQKYMTYGKYYLDQSTSNTVVLYAMWAKMYAIHYVSNGADGEITMDNQYFTEDTSTITLRAPNFSYTNHGFLGWSTNPDPLSGLSASSVIPAETIYGPMETIEVSNNDITLYAVWLESSGTMQSFSSSTCSNTSSGLKKITYSNGNFTVYKGSFKALKDNRDNNVYVVGRLSDGNCWMLENLRLDDSATLTSSNTRNPAISKLPASSSSLYTKDYDTPKINTSNIRQSSWTSATNENSPTYSYGVNYSWPAAVAGRISNSNSNNVEGDICPFNWRLPIGNSYTSNYSFGKLHMSFGGLNGAMNDTTTPTGTEIQERYRQFPNNFVLSGYYGSSLTHYSDGQFWSSTTGDSDAAYTIHFYKTGSLSNLTNTRVYRNYGLAVRCVAGS